MTTESPPRINGMVEVHCTGTLPNGQPCKRLIAIVPTLQQLNGVILPPCKRCKTTAHF